MNRLGPYEASSSFQTCSSAPSLFRALRVKFPPVARKGRDNRTKRA